MYKFTFFLAVLTCSASSIEDLIAQTMRARDKFLAQTASVDSELRAVATNTAKQSSLMQVSSLSKLEEESREFEKSKQAILRKDASLLEQKHKAYLDSLAKLNADATRKGGFSLLETGKIIDSEKLQHFFDPARQAAAKLHQVVVGMHSRTGKEKPDENDEESLEMEV